MDWVYVTEWIESPEFGWVEGLFATRELAEAYATEFKGGTFQHSNGKYDIYRGDHGHIVVYPKKVQYEVPTRRKSASAR